MARDIETLADFLQELAGSAIDEFDTGEEAQDPEQLDDDDKLRLAMDEYKFLNFTYTRNDGRTFTYNARPYSVRGGEYLYATDDKHGASQIHAFIMSRIGGLKVLPKRSFNPVWATEPESV